MLFRSIPERVQTFEASKEKALFYARQAKQHERVERLSSDLRKKYAADWGIDENALAEYTQRIADL